MGNELSQEEQEQILEEAYNEENVDSNGQTTKPKAQREGSNASLEDEGKIPNNTHKHRRASSTNSEREDQEERRKRQHKEQQQLQQDLSAEQKKLSYFQMARLGYQELVNAIIRPPRADYKVSESFGV